MKDGQEAMLDPVAAHDRGPTAASLRETKVRAWSGMECRLGLSHDEHKPG